VEDKPLYVKEEVIAWRDRWKAVKELQTQEWRSLTPEQRFRELVTLYEFAKKNGLDVGQDPTEPRERWARLKKDTPIA
jgi:hypothetical protein